MQKLLNHKTLTPDCGAVARRTQSTLWAFQAQAFFCYICNVSKQSQVSPSVLPDI